MYAQQILTQVANENYAHGDGSDTDSVPDDGERDHLHTPSPSAHTALETATCRDTGVQVKPVSKIIDMKLVIRTATLGVGQILGRAVREVRYRARGRRLESHRWQ
jgi:hypothetical protein